MIQSQTAEQLPVKEVADSLPEDVAAVIAEEERILSTVLKSLTKQLASADIRLDVESQRARELTSSIVAARRDVDKQMLASDEAVSHRLRDLKKDEISVIERLLDSPYFARIVLDEEDGKGGTKKVEFRLGSAANTECRIIDWRRAPISKLFYEYKEGEEFFEEIQGRERSGTIAVRNKLEISDGVLRSINCSLGTFRKNDDGAWTAGRGRSGGSRTGANYGQLPDVLSLITPEQFRSITEDAKTAILIQGIAGSGKTTVALYRLSWLLNEGNSDIERSDAMIVVRSVALRSYIAQSLPQLQIEEVQTRTFSEWSGASLSWMLTEGRGRQEIARPKEAVPPPGVGRVLSSMAMLLGVEKYAKAQRARLTRLLNEKLPAHLLKVITPHLSIGPSTLCINEIIRTTTSVNAKEPSPELEAALVLLETVKKRLALYQKDLIAVLDDTEGLIALDETGLFDRELVKSARDYVAANLERNEISTAEDPLLLRLGQLKREITYRQNGEARKFRQIVIDEAQDFSAPELAVLVGSVDAVSSLTIVGDTGQAISEPGRFPGWEKLRKHWQLHDELAQFVSLTVSHRSTLQIMRLADHINGEQRTTDGRPGKPPLWFHCRNEDQGTEEAIGWLNRVMERYRGSLAAVLCASPKDARFVYGLLEPSFSNAVRLGDDSHFSFEEGVIVTDIERIKGLEFPHVLIWDVSAKGFGKGDRLRNLLYVAVTRAEENLAMVSWGETSPHLPVVNSPLVRGVDRSQEVEEVEEEDPVVAKYLRSDDRGD